MTRGPRRGGLPEADPFDGSPLRVAIVVLVALKIVGLVLVFDPYAAVAFELPKSLFSRATEWALAGLLAAAWVRHGSRIIPRTRLLSWVALLVVATALAAATAEVSYLGLYGDVDRYLGLIQVVDLATLALAVGVAYRSRADWACLALGMMLALAAAVAYAVIQRLGADPFRWTNDTRATTFSTFGNTGFFAEFLVVVLAAAAALLATHRGSRLLAALAALSGASSAAVLLLLAARSTFLGVLGAALVPAAVFVKRGATRRTVVIATIPALLGSVLLVAILIATPLGSRTVATLTGGGLEERGAVYRVALAATLARPLLGWGPDSVGVYEPRFHTAEDERNGLTYALAYKNNSAHSWVLQATATTGLLGLAALLALIAATVRALWSALDRDRPLALTLLTAYATYWVSSLTAVTAVSSAWIPWVVTGGAIALTGAVARQDGPSAGRAARGGSPVPRRLQAPAIVGILALALFGASSGRAALEASHAMHEFRGALREPQDLRSATLLAQRAVALDPGRAVYWDALGFALFASARYAESTAAYEEAVRRAPYEPGEWMSLAQSYARRAVRGEPGDNRGRALAAAARATSIAPNDSSTHEARSLLARELGDHDLAFSEGVAAIELSTSDVFDQLAGDVAGAVRDPASAVRVLERLVATRDSARLQIALARAHLALRDLDAVRRHARRALELQPGNAAATSLLRQAGE